MKYVVLKCVFVDLKDGQYVCTLAGRSRANPVIIPAAYVESVLGEECED